MNLNTETNEDKQFLTHYRQTSFPMIDSCQDEIFDNFLMSNPSLSDNIGNMDALEEHNHKISEIHQNLNYEYNSLKTQPDHLVNQVDEQGHYRFIDNRQYFEQKKNDPDKILKSDHEQQKHQGKMQKLIEYLNIKKHIVHFTKSLSNRLKMGTNSQLNPKTVKFVNDSSTSLKYQVKYSKMNKDKLKQIANTKLSRKSISRKNDDFMFPLKPHRTITQILQVSNFIFCAYCYFIVAMHECFRDKIPNYAKILVLVLQLFFMLCKVNTCRFVEGIQVKDYRTIFLYYLKGVFWVDIIIVFHYSHVMIYGENKLQFGVFSDVLIFVLPWVFKVIKSMKELQKILVDKISNKDIKFISQVLYMVLQVIILCHFLSMVMISNLKAEAKTAKDSSMNYLSAFASGRDIDTNNKWEIYTSTMYWALVTLTTVGYGDITPYTQREVYIMAFTVVLGTTVFAYFIGNIGALIQELGQYQQEVNKHAYPLNAYMDRNNIAQDLQNMVLQNLDYQVKMNMHYDQTQEKESLEILNPKLKEELIVATNIQIVHRCQLLNDYFSYETQRKLALNLQQMKICPGQMVYNQDSMDDPCLYFIQNGQVELYLPGVNEAETNKPLSINNKKKGQYFGQYEFFTNFPRKYSAICEKFTIIFYISRSQFLEIIKTNAKDFETFNMIKDQLIFNPEQSIFNEIACEICAKFDHNEDTCPYVHYICDREKIYKQIQFENKAKQVRRQYRRKNPKHNSRKLYSQHFEKINKVMVEKQNINLQNESIAQKCVQFDYNNRQIAQKDDRHMRGFINKNYSQSKNDNFQSNIMINEIGNQQQDNINLNFNRLQSDDIEQVFQFRSNHAKKQSEDMDYLHQARNSTNKKDDLEQIYVKEWGLKKPSEDVDPTQLQQFKGSFNKRGQEENDHLNQHKNHNVKKYQDKYLDQLGDNAYFSNNVDKQKNYQYYLPHNNLASVTYRLRKFQNLSMSVRSKILKKQAEKIKYNLYQDKYSNYYYASNFKKIQRKRKNIHDLMQNNKLKNGRKSEHNINPNSNNSRVSVIQR